MKKIISGIAIALCSICFAQKNISEEAEKLISRFFDIRMELSLLTDSEEIISRLDSFATEYETEFNACNDQEKLILENFVILEKYNYYFDDKSKKSYLKELMGNQVNKCDKFIGKKKMEEFNKWFLCSRGDLASCYMVFSAKDVLKYGVEVKKFYEASIEQDKEFCYGLMNLGQWYYWAPKIAGGSSKKAIALLEESKACAKTAGTKYYANIFLSQLLFEEKRKEEAASILEEAFLICPESNFLSTIKKCNQKGISLFQYNRNKSDLKDEF